MSYTLYTVLDIMYQIQYYRYTYYTLQTHSLLLLVYHTTGYALHELCSYSSLHTIHYRVLTTASQLQTVHYIIVSLRLLYYTQLFQYSGYTLSCYLVPISGYLVPLSYLIQTLVYSTYMYSAIESMVIQPVESISQSVQSSVIYTIYTQSVEQSSRYSSNPSYTLYILIDYHLFVSSYTVTSIIYS